MSTTAGMTEERGVGPVVPGTTRVRVTRRALFARDLSVWGFELMCAAPAVAAEPGKTGSGEHALGREVQLLNALAELGVKPLVADKTALIAVTRDTLLGRVPLPTSEGTVLVLRVEAGSVDRELIEAADERLDEGTVWR